MQKMQNEQQTISIKKYYGVRHTVVVCMYRYSEACNKTKSKKSKCNIKTRTHACTHYVGEWFICLFCFGLGFMNWIRCSKTWLNFNASSCCTLMFSTAMILTQVLSHQASIFFHTGVTNTSNTDLMIYEFVPPTWIRLMIWHFIVKCHNT